MENKATEKIISEIHLIRHGNTEGTEKKWMYGGIDIPLSPAGIDELAELTRKGIYPCQDIATDTEPDENGETKAPDFYTSGMLRAEQTLFLIYGDVPHGTIPELKELRFGIFEGKSHDELKGNPIYDAWISVEDDNAAPPQGESFREFRDRVHAGWDKLFGYHRIKELSHRHSKLPAHSVIACHGGVIGALMMQLFPEKNLNMYGWIPDPGHGYTIVIKDGKVAEYRGF